jgi:hypothetical protein
MSLLSSLVAGGTLALALIAAWDSWGKYKAQEPGWKVTCALAIGGLIVSVLAAALKDAGIPNVAMDPTRPGPLVNGTPIQLTIKPK